MTKKKEPPVQQAELPMKDITPPKLGKGDPRIVMEPKGKKAAGRVASNKQVPDKTPSGGGKEVAVTGQAQPPAPKSILQIIADATANPNFNPDSMRALLDMQKEIMAEESRRAFNAAFIALQADLATVKITRDGKIEVRRKDASGERTGSVQQATPYATFNSIMKTIQPFLTKHGIALSFSTEPMGERLLVRGYLDGHGHQRTTAFPLPAEVSGSKNNVQGWGSSQSYGKRYCAIALLNLISEDPRDADTDGHQGNFKPAKGGGFAEVPEEVEKISAPQKDTLLAKINWCGVGLATFHNHYGIEKIGDLPAKLYDAAIKACDDFHANKQAKTRHG